MVTVQILLLLLCVNNIYSDILDNEVYSYARNTSFSNSIKNTTVGNLNVKNKPKMICFYVFTNDFKTDIMENLCTHIIVGFFGIQKSDYTVVTTPKKLQILPEIVKLKKRNKELKILISVNSNNFGVMVTNHITRKMFIKSLMKLLKKYEMDGVDLDWEWPVFKGKLKEKVKFIQLLYEIKNEFKRHTKQYILSVDVSAAKSIITLSYYVKYIAQHADIVNVMCYDYNFFSKTYPFTGYNAPLYHSQKFYYFTSNVNDSITYWISQSMPREKIMLGIPTYGHTFKLLFQSLFFVGAPAIGFGSLGNKGFADYGQICKFLKQKNATVKMDEYSIVPFAYKFREWVSYENEISVTAKAEYVLKQQLGGAMVYSVNSDDHAGTCRNDGISLPLIRKISSVLYSTVNGNP